LWFGLRLRFRFGLRFRLRFGLRLRLRLRLQILTLTFSVTFDAIAQSDGDWPVSGALQMALDEVARDQ
jgi:hypothetical protein